MRQKNFCGLQYNVLMKFGPSEKRLATPAILDGNGVKPMPGPIPAPNPGSFII